METTVEMVNVKYLGKVAVACRMPGCHKKIEPNEIVPTTKTNYEQDMKTHKDWELVKETKITKPVTGTKTTTSEVK